MDMRRPGKIRALSVKLNSYRRVYDKYIKSKKKAVGGDELRLAVNCAG